MSSESSSYEESSSSDENCDQYENLELQGKIINNYNVIIELGRGGYSIVWLAYNIVNNNMYALKIQNPSEYKEGYDEIMFVKKLPTKCGFNNLVEYFIEVCNNKKYLCSVWELHCASLDDLIRKGNYKNGLPLPVVKKIMKQLIDSVYILHKKHRVFHGDIKTDNILVRGLNARDNFIINKYKNENFFEKYSKAKLDFCKGDQNILSKMKKKDKLLIRQNIHTEITNKIIKEYKESNISKYNIDPKYIDSIKVSLADFGTSCDEDNFYDTTFGTRYYQAPEILLMGNCSYPVDIWAIGCTFYELLSGKILFDPIKDSRHTRDYYHLYLINQTCGSFSQDFLRKTKYHKKFFDSKCRLIDSGHKDQSFYTRLDTKLNEITHIDQSDLQKIKELLRGMLFIDFSKRTTIERLVDNPFFKD